MPMVLATVLTEGSITHIGAPMLITVDDARFSTPANIDVIAIIKKTAKVIPISRPVNLARSFTSSLNANLRMPDIHPSAYLGSSQCNRAKCRVIRHGVGDV